MSFEIKNETVSRQLIELNRLHHYNWLQPHEGPNFNIGTFAMILVPETQEKIQTLRITGNTHCTPHLYF